MARRSSSSSGQQGLRELALQLHQFDSSRTEAGFTLVQFISQEAAFFADDDSDVYTREAALIGAPAQIQSVPLCL